MPILNGVLLLYLAGRFENFVRQIFEDLADAVASDRKEFSELPKAMRENLVLYTAEIMQNPRKYGMRRTALLPSWAFFRRTSVAA